MSAPRWFALTLVLAAAAACSGGSRRPSQAPPPEGPELGAPGEASGGDGARGHEGLGDGGLGDGGLGARDCIVVQPDFAPSPAAVEGVLAKAGSGGAAPFVLRLARPRCVVGLERASVITEVYVASTAADLRPLVGARLRIRGDAIAGTNDLGGPALLLLAKDLERLEPPSDL